LLLTEKKGIIGEIETESEEKREKMEVMVFE